VQQPRILSAPPRVSTAGDEAVELAAAAGLFLDPWEQFALRESLGERPDGKWSAFEVALIATRQNGKGSIIEARELAGLFLFGERLILHSAHQFDTALEAFRRILSLIEDTPDLRRRVKKVSGSHGSEGIELFSGQRLRFRARTKGGGRGFTGDTLILDEAMYLSEASISALLPTMAARPNPQLWYVGSAVDQESHPEGMTFTRVRNRGMRGDVSLCLMEWSAPGTIDEHDPLDPELWAMANPGLGYRLTGEHIALEQRSMSRRGFATERLGIGDWPSEEDAERTFDPVRWRAAAVDPLAPGSQLTGPIALAVECPPNKARASIGLAGFRADGHPQVELVDNREGIAWAVDRLVELDRSRRPCAIVIDPGGPAGVLINELEARGVKLLKTSTRDFIQACGAFHVGIHEPDPDGTPKTRHPNELLLNAAADAVKWRGVLDSRAFERRNLRADVSPVTAVAMALHGLYVNGQDQAPPNIW